MISGRHGSGGRFFCADLSINLIFFKELAYLIRTYLKNTHAKSLPTTAGSLCEIVHRAKFIFEVAFGMSAEQF
jgi:hypothetical protein